MLDVVINNIYLWFNLSKKGGRPLWPNLHWPMTILGVQERRDDFPLQFRQSLEFPGS